VSDRRVSFLDTVGRACTFLERDHRADLRGDGVEARIRRLRNSDAEGRSKKKLNDEAKSIPFRSIVPFTLKESKKDANVPSTEAKLIVETSAPVRSVPKQSTVVENSAQEVAPGKLSALGKIRNQYRQNGNNSDAAVNQILEQESLNSAWQEYVKILREGKKPSAHSFEMAQLRIKDENSFEAVTADTIEKQFIEQDRNKLFTFLKERLQNKQLQFSVIIEEKKQDGQPKEVSLTAKEQFLKMAEQYPLVRELKERLHLDLDY